MNSEIIIILGGAGFCTSTVSWEYTDFDFLSCVPWIVKHVIDEQLSTFPLMFCLLEQKKRPCHDIENAQDKKKPF